jgi:biofilm PGA synthesis N-glycosyltransferase PgaC
MPEFLFWFSLIFIVYVYAGYPLALFILACLRSKAVLKKTPETAPRVTVVVAARNEAANIGGRIENLLDQDYPEARMEIIVVSDGSEDGTDQVVRELSQRSARVKLVALDPARGKTAALNAGVEAASGDIIVFADSRQSFAPDTVSQLVSNFSDPGVGGVSGELFLVDDANDGARVEMGIYWEYEKWVRKAESRSGSVVGATGAVYAIRKALFSPLPPETILDDVLTPLNIVARGYRMVYDGQAAAYDRVSKNVHQEWRRKVRTLVGNWQLLRLRPALLSPAANPVLFRFLSHKIIRLLVPFLLVLAFGANLFLPRFPYPLFLAAQIACYGAAAAAAVFPGLRRIRLLNLLYFFCVLNAAAAVAFIKFATGRTGKLWARPAADLT